MRTNSNARRARAAAVNWEAVAALLRLGRITATEVAAMDQNTDQDKQNILAFLGNIQKYSEANPDKQHICQPFIERMQRILDGSAVSIKANAGGIMHALKVQATVKIPEDMGIGSFIKKMAEAEKLLNNSFAEDRLVFRLEID